MTWNEGLTGKALQIAEADSRFLRVMAGPGTGKSFAMKRRITRLLEEGVEPGSILAVTFTRVAAADLVREIAGLGIEGCDGIRAGTLHSLCFSILNKQDVLHFTGRVPRPLVTFSSHGVLQFEAAPLLEDIKTEGKRKDTKRIQAFDAAWARLQSDTPGWSMDPADKQFHQRLISWLLFHRAMLIGELVPEVLKYLRTNPECPERTAYAHVIVDEYQDLNRADQVLLDLLGQGDSVIIGDENQSIYRFRYAHPEGIKEYSTSHPDTLDHDLDECRRCPKRVVELANTLILNNHPEAATPKLLPRPENEDGEVHIVQWGSMTDEARGIANYIKHLTENRDYNPGDVMILCGRRLIAYQIRDAVAALELPIHSFFQEEALDSDKAQKAFATLTLLANPEDRVALRYLLGCESPSWLKGEYAKLRDLCESTGASPTDTLKNLLAGTVTLACTRKLVSRYEEIQNELESLKPLTGKTLLDTVAVDCPENKILRETILPTMGDDMKPVSMVEAVRSAVTQPQMPEDGKFVRIMSLQKSKGLTSKIVIVASCVEGIIPVAADSEPPAEQVEILKEQRRLFYVAVTRPTDILVISSFANITPALAMQTRVSTQGSWRNRTHGSRFIDELGPTAPAGVTGDDWRTRGYVSN